MSSNLTTTSKFLSLVLRHKPDEIGLTLDEQGWADIDQLIHLANQHSPASQLTRELIEKIVADSDKKRFALSDDGKRIRANQGHSVEVNLGLQPTAPPALLYHGTATRFMDSIRATGLVPGQRQHVHLSSDVITATKVGQRHGKPCVLTIRAGDMHRDGIAFFLSENGVWLTLNVPAKYIAKDSL